jgi:hypothetical protein
MSREEISLIVIQRQLGHADLAITSRYLRGIDSTEIIQAVHQRPEPMIPAVGSSWWNADRRWSPDAAGAVRRRTCRGLTRRLEQQERTGRPADTGKERL